MEPEISTHGVRKMGRHHPLNRALGTVSPLGFSVFCKFPTRNLGPLSSSSWRGGGERRAPRANTSLTDLDSRRARRSLWGQRRKRAGSVLLPSLGGQPFPARKRAPLIKNGRKGRLCQQGPAHPETPPEVACPQHHVPSHRWHTSRQRGGREKSPQHRETCVSLTRNKCM